MPSSHFKPESIPSLSGRTYIVTGGNAGIGKATVVELAHRGAKVYIGTRNESKAQEAIEQIKKAIPEADIHFLKLDLTSFESVRGAVESFKSTESSLHGLINNAGIMAVPFSKTSDGYEIQWQTNYVSPWLLTELLLPTLLETSQSSGPGSVRIVNVTSDGHSMAPSKVGINFDDTSLESQQSMRRYGQSKLANILHAAELNRRFGPNGSELHDGKKEIWISAVHPGHIDTDLNRQATALASSTVLHVLVPIMRFLGILDDQQKGAWSSVFAIASDDFKAADSGKYVVPYAKFGTPSKMARDGALAKRLWNWTMEQLNEKRYLKKEVDLDHLKPS